MVGGVMCKDSKENIPTNVVQEFELNLLQSQKEKSFIIDVKPGNSPRKKDFFIDLTANSRFNSSDNLWIQSMNALKLANDLNLLNLTDSDEKNTESFLMEVFNCYGKNFGKEQAREASKEFNWPIDSMVAQDLKEFQTFNYDLIKLAREKFSERALLHLSTSRVLAMKSLDLNSESVLDWDRAFQIAEKGVPIFIPDGFINKQEPRPVRKSVVDLANSVHTSILKFWKKGYCKIFPDIELKNFQGKLHYSELTWAVQWGKVNGRTCADVSAINSEVDPLNSEEAKLFGEKEFGQLFHPTVEDYVKVFMAAMDYYKSELDKGDDYLVMTKVDISDAFMQLSLEPESTPFVCFSLAGGFSLVYLTAFFGHTYFPQAWGVINRLLIRLAICSGILFILGYVDDFSSITLHSQVAHNLSLFKSLAVGLLGKGCINDEKDEKGEVIVHIGWEFNLKGGPLGISGRPVGTVSLSNRYLSKVVFVFFNIPIDWKLRRDDIERLASHMVRISSIVFLQLRPYAAILFNEIRGLKRNIEKSLGVETINAILIWRAFLLAIHLRPQKYSRNFPDIIMSEPIIYANFDASLEGLGIRLFHMVNGSVADCFKVVQVPLDPKRFDFSLNHDPAFQNAVEFLAVSLIMFVIVRAGFTSCSIHLGGDSISALYWSCFLRSKGHRSRLAAFAQATHIQEANIRINRNF
jgi:hypothetical protein